MPAAEEAQARMAAEAAEAAALAAEAAALAEAEALGVAPSEVFHVLDAVRRSPLMLELPANTPGLAAVAELVRLPGRGRAS